MSIWDEILKCFGPSNDSQRPFDYKNIEFNRLKRIKGALKVDEDNALLLNDGSTRELILYHTAFTPYLPIVYCQAIENNSAVQQDNGLKYGPDRIVLEGLMTLQGRDNSLFPYYAALHAQNFHNHQQPQ